MPYTSFHAGNDGANERNETMSNIAIAFSILLTFASFAFVGAMVALAFI